MLFTMITILYGKEVMTNTFGSIDFILPQPKSSTCDSESLLTGYWTKVYNREFPTQ